MICESEMQLSCFELMTMVTTDNVIFLVTFKEKEEKKKWLVFLHSEET